MLGQRRRRWPALNHQRVTTSRVYWVPCDISLLIIMWFNTPNIVHTGSMLRIHWVWVQKLGKKSKIEERDQNWKGGSKYPIMFFLESSQSFLGVVSI